MRLAGVILAGGRGERLGVVVKASLMVGGVRLIERVAVRMPTCDPLYLAHGPNDPSQMGGGESLVPIADAPGMGGPLAGIAAAALLLAREQNAPELLLSAAVDTPFLPPDFAERLLAGIGDAPAAVVAYAGQAYPTNALWRVADLLALLEQSAPPNSPMAAARLLGAVEIAWPAGPAGDPFANVNTPAELAALDARAARGEG